MLERPGINPVQTEKNKGLKCHCEDGAKMWGIKLGVTKEQNEQDQVATLNVGDGRDLGIWDESQVIMERSGTRVV